MNIYMGTCFMTKVVLQNDEDLPAFKNCTSTTVMSREK